MCEIMRELNEESWQEGKEEGKREGIEVGRKEGIEVGRKEGRKKGKKEGKEEGKTETALNMLKLGEFTLEKIAVCSGLPLKKIEKLAKQLEDSK